MKTRSLTIRLDQDLDILLTKVSRRAGKSRSETAREALRWQLRIWESDASRQKMRPSGETGGYLTDEDVFDQVS
jgi:predicted transcriptional regulator